MLPVIGPIRPWADPTINSMNRGRQHAPLGGFTRRSLEGEWSLAMFTNPDDAVLDDSTEVTVDVPGNWTMQDLGDFVDLPAYTNIQMPFPGPPPRLPDRNPTGVYRRRFDIPKSWLSGSKRVVFGVDGAESVHAVYMNGAFVGYGTDSRLPSEYDITEHVTAGTNEVAVAVVKFSAHSYIEDQDQWWMGGLHRSVWVESRRSVHLIDVSATTDYDPETGQGSIDTTAVVDFGGAPGEGWLVRTSITAPNGKPVPGRAGRNRETPVPHLHAQPYVFTDFAVVEHFEVAKARPWSAERPDRYTVRFELISPAGAVVQVEEQAIGINRVEVADRALLVNGEPVWIFGVNRHDHHPERGKAVTVGDMRADLEAMRRLNINAVRTSHYPNDHRFYDLCDELGFYVIDEANIESHGYNRHLCDDPTYRSAWLERGSRMVQRDRNHPCIIAWSLGNESGYGDNHRALAGWIRAADPSRPLHYEDAVRIEGWVDGGRDATDIVCPMYPTHAEIAAYRGDRPLIMCEYSHAMGNSNGGLADYWDIITGTPGLQGGFIWEWKDHGLRRDLPDGTHRLAYGGMFGEEIHDGNFVADGIMSADIEPHPAANELTWVHRPVVVTLADDGSGLVVENRRSFTDLSDLRAEWEWLPADAAGDADEAEDAVAGDRIAMGRIGPGEIVVVGLPSRLVAAIEADGGDGWLTIRWFTRADTWFADGGHAVAWDQIELGDPLARPGSEEDPDWAAGPDDAGVTEPVLNLWRAPTDNDGFKLMPELSRRLGVGGAGMVRWADAGLNIRPADHLVRHAVDVVDDGTGPIVYHHVVDVPEELADLPRVGVTFAVPARFGRMRWVGRGPWENYPDRNRSATVGVWSATVDSCPYLVPQEYGLRTDCRWLELIDDESGEVVRIEAVVPATLHTSVTTHSEAELYQAAHHSELEAGPEMFVHLDLAHRGVGTASCGPDTLDEYRLPAGRYEFAYRVMLLGD